MIALIIIVLVAALFILAVMPGKDADERMEPFASWKYAHRGLHDNATDAPENSAKAFRLAVDNGYGVELDLHLTTDGRLVVFHDDDLKRVCGADEPVEGKSYDELMRYSLFQTGQKMPLFEEVLAIMDGRTPMIIELKYQKDYQALCKKTMELLRGYDGLYCVESFHPSIVKWFRDNAPEVTRGILSMDYSKEGKQSFFQWAGKNLFEDFLIRPHFVAYCHEQDSFGFWIWRNIWQSPCVAWTVKSQQREDEISRRFMGIIFEGYKSSKPC